MLKRLLWTDNDPAGLVMRLALGAVMFPHGAQKVFGWFGGYGASATIQGFAKMGLPPWLTVLVMAAGLGGALPRIVGVLTRFPAFSIAGRQACALVRGPPKRGFFMSRSGARQGEGVECHN